MTKQLKTYLALSLTLFSTSGCVIVIPFAQVKNDDQFKKEARIEARVNVGSLNKAQKIFHLQKNKFAKSVAELESRFDWETKYFIYVSKLITPTRVQSFATPKVDGLTPSVGGVIYTKVQDEDQLLATLCRSDQPSKTAPPEMIFKEGESPICPEGYHKYKED
jgi:hypothetical protein